MPENPIVAALSSTLKAAGFRRKASSWYSDAKDAILVINLQKSQFGDQYYLNLAIWLRALGESSFPKEQECHVRFRAVSLDPERQSFWEREVFDLTNDAVAPSARSDLIRDFLEKKVMPTFLRCGSLEDLHSLFSSNELKNAAVTRRAQALLRSTQVSPQA